MISKLSILLPLLEVVVAVFLKEAAVTHITNSAVFTSVPGKTVSIVDTVSVYAPVGDYGAISLCRCCHC